MTPAFGSPVGLGEQAPADPAKLTQTVKLVESAAQNLGDDEQVLAVWYRGQDLLIDPLTVDQHPLLMAGRAEAERALASGDFDVQQIVLTHADLLPAALGPMAEQLQQQITHFLYDEALRTLGQAGQNLPQLASESE